jgi:hypothetical protein
VLALTQVAEAKVVFTPVHQAIGANGVYDIDLTGDGTVNFLIQQLQSGYPSNNALLCDAAVGNGVVGDRGRFASALSAGASIGPKQNFVAGGPNGEAMLSVTHFTTGGTSVVRGFWENVTNRYLGLKFQLAGETHYGWVRVSVLRKANVFSTLVTGYAFETTPNTAIIAGQTSGAAASDDPRQSNSESSVAEVSSVDQTAAQQYKSLGELALGTLSVPQRRQP